MESQRFRISKNYKVRLVMIARYIKRKWKRK